MRSAALDAGLPNNAKVTALSDGAFRLYVLARCFCAANLTDGFIDRAALIRPLAARKRDVTELVEAGLWQKLESGSVVDNDYLEHNPTRADTEADRQRAMEGEQSRLASDRERQRRHRERKRNASCHVTQGVTERDGHGQTNVTECVTGTVTLEIHSPQTPLSPSGSSNSSGITDVPPSYQPPSETEQVARATQKPSRKRRETELPEGWNPTEKHAAKAREKGLDVALESERFRERALAKGLRYVDWDRAFNTWLLSPFAQPSVNGKPPGALDHEARRIEANTRHEHRAWLLEQALSGAFGAKAQAAAEAGQIDRLEAWYEQQRGRRAAGASGSGGPAQIGGLLEAALGGRPAPDAR